MDEYKDNGSTVVSSPLAYRARWFVVKPLPQERVGFSQGLLWTVRRGPDPHVRLVDA